MLYLIKWMYAWILPLGGIVLAFMILTALLFRKKQAGRWAMLVITAVFYLLSTEPVSDSLIRPLEMAYEQPSLEALDGDVIIVLGGGSRAGVPDVDGVGQVGSAAANRFLTALRLEKLSICPSCYPVERSLKVRPMNRRLKSGCSCRSAFPNHEFLWTIKVEIRQRTPLSLKKFVVSRAGKSPSSLPAPSICRGQPGSSVVKEWTSFPIRLTTAAI